MQQCHKYVYVAGNLLNANYLGSMGRRVLLSQLMLKHLLIASLLIQQISSKNCKLRDVFLTSEEYDKHLKHLDSMEILERCNFPPENEKKTDKDNSKAVANAQILLQVPKDYQKEYHPHEPIYPHHYHPSPKVYLPIVPNYAQLHSAYHSLIFPHYHPENCLQNNVFENQKNDKCVCTKKEAVAAERSNEIKPMMEENRNKSLILPGDIVALSARNKFGEDNEDDEDKDLKQRDCTKYFIPFPWKHFLKNGMIPVDKDEIKRPDKDGKLKLIKVHLTPDHCGSCDSIVRIEAIKDIDIDCLTKPPPCLVTEKPNTCCPTPKPPHCKLDSKKCHQDYIMRPSFLDFSRFPSTAKENLHVKDCYQPRTINATVDKEQKKDEVRWDNLEFKVIFPENHQKPTLLNTDSFINLYQKPEHVQNRQKNEDEEDYFTKHFVEVQKPAAAGVLFSADSIPALGMSQRPSFAGTKTKWERLAENAEQLKATKTETSARSGNDDNDDDGATTNVKSARFSGDDHKIYFEDAEKTCTNKPECGCPNCAPYSKELNEFI